MPRKRVRIRLSKFNYFTIRSVLLILIILAFFSALEKRIRPLVTTMSEYQCKIVSVLAMNQAVSEVILDNEGLYAQLVETRYAEDGTVATAVVNTGEVNRIKEELTKAVSNKLLSIEKQKIGIPLGSLTGWQLLSGRGPVVSLDAIPTSFVKSEIINKLESAGINQTQHRIFVKFTVEMSAIMAGYSTSVKVDSEMCIAQMLVVGKVPQLYAVSDKNL